MNESECDAIGSQVKHGEYRRKYRSPYAGGSDEYVSIRFEAIKLVDDRKKSINEPPGVIRSGNGKKSRDEEEENGRKEHIDPQRDVGYFFGDKKIIRSF